jgi:hypothetical protein
LPIIGEKGTILDYENAYSGVSKSNKKVTKDKKVYDDTDNPESLYRADEDTWAAYCQQYYEHYGRYPDGATEDDKNETLQDNSLYSLKKSSPVPKKSKSLVVDYPSSDDD